MQIRLTPDASSLEPQWWHLWERSARATPFQSPAWLLPWARQFARESLVLAAYDDDVLAALVPLVRFERRLLLWGAGTSDWLDGVFLPGLDLSALHEALLGLGEPLDLFQLPRGSPLLSLAARQGTAIVEGEPCVAIDLDLPLPAKMAANLAYYRRRAQRAGIVGPSRLGPEGFAPLIELHGRRWNSSGQPGVLRDPAVLAWHAETMPRLANAGMLRLYGLAIEDRAVGVLYAMSARQRTYYYLSGIDPEFAPLGLGTILIGHAIDEARREGCTGFDFLRGREPYKYHWGGVDVPSAAIRIEVGESSHVVA